MDDLLFYTDAIDFAKSVVTSLCFYRSRATKSYRDRITKHGRDEILTKIIEKLGKSGEKNNRFTNVAEKTNMAS